jgi:hypothetical protein
MTKQNEAMEAREGNCYGCRKLTPYRCQDHPGTFRCEDCDCDSGPSFGLPTCELPYQPVGMGGF